MTKPPIDRRRLQDGDVIDFGEVRLKAKGSRFSATGCQHLTCEIDADAGTLTCAECGVSVSPFSRLLLIAENRKAIKERDNEYRRRISDLFQQVRNYRPHLRAAKALEEVWRGRRMAPCCPHCHTGLLPEDFERISGGVSVELERQRRKKEKS